MFQSPSHKMSTASSADLILFSFESHCSLSPNVGLSECKCLQVSSFISDYLQDHDKETHKEWGDRIAEEYKEKHKRRYNFRETKSAKKQKLDEEEEKKKAFQRKLEKEHNEYIERVKKVREERQLKSLAEEKASYELHCKEVFAPTDDILSYRDIPWPYPPDKGIRAMKDFLLCDIHKTDTKAVKKYLRDQQVRWHPDKFVQKCGGMLKDSERDRILTRVKQISQEINRLIEELVQE